MPNRKSLLDAGEKDFRLTRFERRIIALTVAGYSPREGARRLGIAVPALKLRLSRIHEKLSVSNPFELILFALYYRLVDPPLTLPEPILPSSSC